MNPEFWHGRWQRGETGWHEGGFNRHLTAHWTLLDVPSDAQVLVPLCGKSRDMLWLAGRGHCIIGVEISALAAEAFFGDNDLTPIIDDRPPFRRCRVDEIQLLVGDFFDLRAAHTDSVSAVFDRASLIALPPAMRLRYARHLASVLRFGAQILLITMDYDQTRMNGPPFAVDEAEVHALFQRAFSVEPIADLDVLASSPRFGQRGLDWLREHIYRLRRL